MPEDRPAPAPLSRPALGAQSANHLPVPLPTPSTSRTPLKPMPRGVITTAVILISTVTIVLTVWLWWAGTAGLSGAELVKARLDALRTGLSIGLSTGGVFALYLAWRRQNATEIGLVQKERDQEDVARAYELQRETAEHNRLHAERVAGTTERDAEARRITDLYAKSVEQLGSDKAPVRHGGLYALERLAQDHPDNPALRQTVVNVLCAYLRAPFDLPDDPPDADADRATRDVHREQIQEREVRLTAQRILTAHLNPGSDADLPAATFWADIDLDLTSAVLTGWDMDGCLLRSAIFRRANFADGAQFIGTTFTGYVSFRDATFTEESWFAKAKFTQNAVFSGATFLGEAWFSEATFSQNALFDGATFIEDVWFDQTTFGKSATFGRTTFTEDVMFDNATFIGHTAFGGATLRYSPLRSSLDYSSWPTRWRPSPDHTAMEGREGTWHRILRVTPAPTDSNVPSSESIDD